MNEQIAVVLVTFKPSLEKVRSLITTINEAGALSVVVDNTEEPAGLDGLKPSRLIQEGRNRGIGWAHNRGVSEALSAGASFAVFLDQDSAMSTAQLREYLSAATKAFSESRRIAAVGPLLVDKGSGRPLLFREGTFRTFARNLSEDDIGRIDVPFLPTSGMMVDLRRFGAVGSFREDFFIDHVDREWGMRARERGFSLVVLRDFAVIHELGDFNRTKTGKAGFFHSNLDRDYYLKRNTILMVRAGRGRLRWRLGEICFAMASALKCVLVDPPRGRVMLGGLRDGAFGRSGARQSPIDADRG